MNYPDMLSLASEDVKEVLSMELCLEALETAYSDQAEGRAAFSRRQDVLTPTDTPKEVTEVDGHPITPPVIHGFKSMGGTVRSMNVAAVRLNSDLINWPLVRGTPRRVKIPAAPGGRYTALILLFSTKTGELLSIMPDGQIQRMRVGGTNAIAADLMAKPDATSVALLGAGWQAGAHARAIDAIRDIGEIFVYSPNSREEFAEEMNECEELTANVVPIESPESACSGADIVICATNQVTPVFSSDYLEPGMHVTCVRRVEIDASAYNSADRLVIHSNEQTQADNYFTGESAQQVPEYTSGWNHPESDEIKFEWEDLPQLAEIIDGGVDRDAEDITVFVNNIGLGIQFAAVGKRVFEGAKDRGLGENFPIDRFSQPYRP